MLVLLGEGAYRLPFPLRKGLMDFTNPKQTYTAEELVAVLEHSYVPKVRHEGSTFYVGYQSGMEDLATTLIARLKMDTIRGVEIPRKYIGCCNYHRSGGQTADPCNTIPLSKIEREG